MYVLVYMCQVLSNFLIFAMRKHVENIHLLNARGPFRRASEELLRVDNLADIKFVDLKLS